MFHRILFLLSIIFFVFSYVTAEEQSVLLNIQPVNQNFFDSAKQNSDPLLKDAPKKFIVIGLINTPSFLIRNISNVTLFDASGKNVPLLVEKSSLYSEFNDEYINSMRIAFTITQEALKAGPPRLVWGENISSDNTQIESIQIYKNSKKSYLTFTLEPAKSIDNMSYQATIEVIVDEYADKYYLWYLLPIILIFVLLFIRRFFR
ncbi:hypothetical protein ACFL5N_00550 [bacterium]